MNTFIFFGPDLLLLLFNQAVKPLELLFLIMNHLKQKQVKYWLISYWKSTVHNQNWFAVMWVWNSYTFHWKGPLLLWLLQNLKLKLSLTDEFFIVNKVHWFWQCAAVKWSGHPVMLYTIIAHVLQCLLNAFSNSHFISKLGHDWSFFIGFHDWINSTAKIL